jgi:signal transduction histidine kinase
MTANATCLPPAPDQGDPAPAYQRALFNILEDSVEEKERLASMQTAALNIMEDFSNERARFAQTQTAVINILEDSVEEKERLASMQTAALNIMDDFSNERARLAQTQTAALNIMDDFSNERARLAQTQTAVINILEDSDAERAKLERVQTAALNILEDFGAEQAKLERTQTATLNILEDFDAERRKMFGMQTATLNILEDFDAEKRQLAQSQRALLNMLEDIDLERSKVTSAFDRVELANKELDEFAYVASHDLKAPLRVIDNASRWLEEDLAQHLTDETRENMALLRGRVRRMEKLLDDLLDYSRVGRKFDDRYQEIVTGTELIGNILAMLSPPAGFTVTVSPNFGEIGVPRMPLQQILMNLIGNAIKHHDKKEGRIEVTVEDQGDYLGFTVKDDGPGIPKEYHDKIFKMFQTLKPRDQVEGSGMGLAIIKKHLDFYGGTIALDSDTGKGSTFRFAWPKRQRRKGAAA